MLTNKIKSEYKESSTNNFENSLVGSVSTDTDSQLVSAARVAEWKLFSHGFSYGFVGKTILIENLKHNIVGFINNWTCIVCGKVSF